MRYIFLLISIWSLYSMTAVAASSSPIPYGSTLNFVVNLNNIQEAQTTNTNSFTKQHMNESPLLDKISRVWIDPNTNKNLVERMKNNTSSFMNENKWYLLMAGALSAYAYICYIVASGNRYLARKELWSSWRQDLTMEELLAIPQPQFAKELLQEIQRRYTDPAAITDIVRPLSAFMKMIEQEEQQLLGYQSAISWLEYSKIIKIIPVGIAAFSKIPERIQRLTYFKNAFQTWAAQYQLQQVSRMLTETNEIGIPDISPMAALMTYHYKISLLNYLAQKQLRITPIP